MVERFREHCARGRALVGEALAGINGVRYAAPVGAFYGFIGVDGLEDSLELAKKLVVKHKVGVAPGVVFGMRARGI